MTNEDAIKMLNTLYSVDVYVNEVLDVAIKALEERPQGGESMTEIIKFDEKYADLIVFDNQPQRQLETPDCHND